MAQDMPKAYDATATERRWYEEWLRRGYFEARADTDREPYCIVLPPPNVTGSLHIGHAYQQTNQDVIIRRRRMQGYEALWLPGTDHAGIATQVVVERELAREGTSREELGREAFIQRVWEWKEQYGNRIVHQMQALGNSCDWSRLRFTMDESLSRAVREAFVTLYEDGLIYRGERIINWCPKDGTALSDSEVEHDDVAGELITFAYPLAGGSGRIEVATTRIETMLGDTGIAVHPDDPRYRDLVGKAVRHPFDGRELPIVADPAVDPSFATGAVKVTPAHDPTDFDIAERTGLPLLNVLDARAHLNENVPERFWGLDRYAARRAVRDALEELGLLVKEERPFVHPVGHCYRCHTEIEPWISGKQWFVAVDRLKGPAMEVAEDGRLAFHPERWTRNYLEWLQGLRDWNISRQLWWGHRIPVWYCANGHEFAAREDPAGCPHCGSADLEQDPDVLDTWFSSQLWPFSTLGWPDDTPDLRTFHPTSVLVTGYEILYLWVARMVMSGMYFTGDVPFRHTMIHGLVRDARGRKMSKSLGNVIDPLDVIESHGADALRFALMRIATGQQDIPLSMDAVEVGRNFANKIWNAARLVLGAGDVPTPAAPGDERSLVERWILSRLEACRDEVDRAIEEYRLADAARALQRFLWAEFCDWGLEMEKARLQDPATAPATAAILAWVLERTLRLLHPIMPFVTEDLWQRLRPEDAAASIVVAPWPEPRPADRDPDAELRFSFAEDLVVALRRFRSDHRIAPSLRLRVRLAGSAEQRSVAEELAAEIGALARLEALELVDAHGEGTGAARLIVQGAEVLIPLEGVLDMGDELRRIERRLAELRGAAESAERKLANLGFTEKAPPDVVEKERARLVAATDEIATLEVQL
ncbi:MAG TPA: valine--tRNA ligase, partial [Actinomycetota bacterium]|nr:valine--tRNA ligase [Actinomycetota bacterium]